MKSDWLHQSDGPLTRDLVLTPGKFGLGRIPERLTPAATATAICGYCATGCQLKVHLDENGEAINLSPSVHYPVNLGMACPKGWQALDPLAAPDRGTTPLLLGADGTRRAIGWAEAMEAFVTRLRSIRIHHGRDAAAFLSTGQIPIEEMAFLGLLWRSGMGFLHGDANTRQCMATAVTAYKQAFGFDAPPYTYADFEESDVIVLVGSNLCISHPILWQRVMRNPRSPRIVVIDPRATETAQAATRHVALKPKGDLALLLALAHCILRDGRTDPAWLERCSGLEELRGVAAEWPPERAAPLTGQTPEEIERLAHEVSAPGQRVSWWWTMGVNQSHEGVRTAQAIINLCLITGNIGRPGTGPNSITGQCNAMGSRLFSNTTSLVGGHDFADDSHRRKVARITGIPADRIPNEPSLAYDRILAAAEKGEIKALWVVATNPFHSWIDSGRLAALRERLEFLVVQDLYADTETARVADLYLPAAGWGEKAGTFINSERRIATIRPVRRPPGLVLSDFRIFRLVARAWGCEDLFTRWTDPESVFLLLRDLTADRPCDFTGIAGYEHLDQAAGIQWPFPAGTGQAPAGGERRLFEDGIFPTSDGRARLIVAAPAPLPEAPDDDFPLLLITGRGSSSQWHTGTRTGRSSVLKKLHPTLTCVEIHPEDARSLGIADGGRVVVGSRRGEMAAVAYLAPTMRRGEVFVAMHDAAVNRLTHPSFDPHSRQPNYKACAVWLRPA